MRCSACWVQNGVLHGVQWREPRVTMGNQLGVSGGSLQDLPSLLLELVSTLCFRRNLGGGKVHGGRIPRTAVWSDA